MQEQEQELHTLVLVQGLHTLELVQEQELHMLEQGQEQNKLVQVQQQLLPVCLPSQHWNNRCNLLPKVFHLSKH